jgi:hypothetical protein
MDSATAAIEIDRHLPELPTPRESGSRLWLEVPEAEPQPAGTATAADDRVYVAHFYAREPRPWLYAGSFATPFSDFTEALRSVELQLPFVIGEEERANIQEMSLRLERMESPTRVLALHPDDCARYLAWLEQVITRVRLARECTELEARAYVAGSPERWWTLRLLGYSARGAVAHDLSRVD